MASTPVNGCRHCGIPAREHYQRWHRQIQEHGKWVPPTQDQIKARMLTRRHLQHRQMLQECIDHLHRTLWACDTQDAVTLTAIAGTRDDLDQGSDLWNPEEILLIARQAKTVAQDMERPRDRRAVLYLAQELESHLPTPASVTAQARHVVELAQSGDTEQARARHLSLWNTVLTLISYGHGDATALATAARAAYDTTAEDFVLNHLS